MHPVCDFPFNDVHITELEKSLSPGRMNLYQKFAEKNGIEKKDVDSEALKLYCWNSALNRALYWPLHGLEVGLRNAMADRLCDRHGDEWYQKLNALKQGQTPNEEVEKVDKVKKKLKENGEQHGHDAIVAGISFGFWEGLLRPEYEKKLWAEREMFSEIFPVSRDDAFKNINQVKRLRNSIAHHEPIFVHWLSKNFRPLYKDYKKIIKIIRWASPETANWVEHHSSAEFFETWNLTPNWMSEVEKLKLKNNADALGINSSDNWCW